MKYNFHFFFIKKKQKQNKKSKDLRHKPNKDVTLF